MSYTKLMLAVTGGILLAVAIICAIAFGPDAYHRYQIRKSLDRLAKQERLRECAAPGSCPDFYYAMNVGLVRSKHFTQAAAVADYCAYMATAVGEGERREQIRSECLASTTPRMADDLK